MKAIFYWMKALIDAFLLYFVLMLVILIIVGAGNWIHYLICSIVFFSIRILTSKFEKRESNIER